MYFHKLGRKVPCYFETDFFCQQWLLDLFYVHECMSFSGSAVCSLICMYHNLISLVLQIKLLSTLLHMCFLDIRLIFLEMYLQRGSPGLSAVSHLLWDIEVFFLNFLFSQTLLQWPFFCQNVNSARAVLFLFASWIPNAYAAIFNTFNERTQWTWAVFTSVGIQAINSELKVFAALRPWMTVIVSRVTIWGLQIHDSE